jgi:hypothetical protein
MQQMAVLEINILSVITQHLMKTLYIIHNGLNSKEINTYAGFLS